MSKATPKHRLTEVDRQRRTALCSVCGPTQIYVAKPGKEGRIRIFCVQSKRESERKSKQKHLEKNRLGNPSKKPRHVLTQIDAEKMMAICSVCGPTDIRKRSMDQKYTIYICATHKRAYAHEYKRSHYIPHPHKPKATDHSLSEIDRENKTAVCLQCGPVRIQKAYGRGRTFWKCRQAQNEGLRKRYWRNRKLIDEYKVKHGCSRCGYADDPSKLELHRRAINEEDAKTWLLARLGRERLLQELAQSDVYCGDCHEQLHSADDLQTK